MEGEGHFADWGKQKDEKSVRAKKKKAKAANARLRQLRQKAGIKDAQESVKPTHFDLAPILKALKRFLACDAEFRSQTRTLFWQERKSVRAIFVDEYGEPSFKKCVDIDELSKKLAENKIALDANSIENLGPALICFGSVEYDNNWGDRVPLRPKSSAKQSADWTLCSKTVRRKKRRKSKRRKH